MRNTAFKSYSQNQLMLLPPDLSELIDEKHLVRIIDSVIDGVDFKIFARAFENTGQPPYNPRMMMKVLIYAYSTKLYSSRKIEKALKQDITYMWLAGWETPDHNTINRFRSNYFIDVMEDVFTHVLDFLRENNYVKFETFFVDGTKLEANAGKHTYVWKKNVARFKDQLREKVKQLFKEIKEINQQEDLQYAQNSLPELGNESEIDSKKLKTIVEELNQDLRQKAVRELKKKTTRTIQSRINKIKKKAEQLQGYEEQEKTLDKRNSFSKTDTDATMMRMKGTDELRPGYNQQISTAGQYIVNYSVHSNASDTPTFGVHLQKIINRGAQYLPKNYCGDAAYGSEENYETLAALGIESYLKYNTFHQEITGKDKSPFQKGNMKYDAENDLFICPNGKLITYDHQEEHITENGYKTQVKVYTCKDCEGCPLRDKCTKSKNGRSIQIRENLDKLKAKARDSLQTEKGRALQRQRGWDVETVFADQKHNQQYTRIRLRGREKAEMELGYLSISHNLRKVHTAQIITN